MQLLVLHKTICPMVVWLLNFVQLGQSVVCGVLNNSAERMLPTIVCRPP
jgi:hypothetical protein